MKAMILIKYFLTAVVILFFVSVQGQEEEIADEFDMIVVPKDSDGEARINISKQYEKKKMQFGMEVGTSFGFSPGNGSGMNYYLAPHVDYQLSPRFTLTAGMALSQGQYYLPYHVNSEQDAFLPMTRVFLYSRGTYAVSDRLTVSGTAHLEMNDIPNLYQAENSRMQFNSKGMSMSMNYKLGKSMSVGIQVGVRENNYPLGMPYGMYYGPGW